MRFRSILVLGLGLAAAACSGNVFDLSVGDCFDDPDDFSEVSSVEIVDCAEPHDNEVYHLFDLPDGDYPGSASVEASAVEGCLAAFDAFVGKDYAESRLDITYFYPSPETWEGEDREVVCSLYDLNGTPMTDSRRGSGI